MLRVFCAAMLGVAVNIGAARAEGGVCGALESVSMTESFVHSIPNITGAAEMAREINQMSAAITAAEHQLAAAGDEISPAQQATVDRYLNDLRYAILMAGSMPPDTVADYMARPALASRLAGLSRAVEDAGCGPALEEQDTVKPGEAGELAALTGLGDIGQLDSIQSQANSSRSILLSPRGPLIIFLALSFIAIGMVWYIRRDKRKRRRAHRYFCHAPAAIRYGHSESRTIIVDISRLGAKINAVPALKPREPIVLMVHNGWTAGKIVWANEHFAGVLFNQPVSRAQIHGLTTPAQLPTTPFAGKKGSARPGTAFSKRAEMRR